MTPPKALIGSHGERALVGVERVAPSAAPHGLLCLTITHAGDPRSRGRARARGVEVEQVVERELLAVVLAHRRQHVRARADLRVEGGALVRVLAVGQVDDLLVGAHVERREVLASARRTSARSPCRSGRCRRTPRRRAHSRVGSDSGRRRLAQLLEHGVVGLRADARRPRTRGSSPPRGSSSGRRCRCSRSTSASADAARARPCARTGRGSRRRGRRTRSSCSAAGARCAGSSRTRQQARRRAAGAAS